MLRGNGNCIVLCCFHYGGLSSLLQSSNRAPQRILTPFKILPIPGLQLTYYPTWVVPQISMDEVVGPT
eukprot:449872-Ditylum_brightwellii.AAC.1